MTEIRVILDKKEFEKLNKIKQREDLTWYEMLTVWFTLEPLKKRKAKK